MPQMRDMASAKREPGLERSSSRYQRAHRASTCADAVLNGESIFAITNVGSDGVSASSFHTHLTTFRAFVYVWQTRNNLCIINYDCHIGLLHTYLDVYLLNFNGFLSIKFLHAFLLASLWRLYEFGDITQVFWLTDLFVIIAAFYSDKQTPDSSLLTWLFVRATGSTTTVIC